MICARSASLRDGWTGREQPQPPSQPRIGGGDHAALQRVHVPRRIEAKTPRNPNDLTGRPARAAPSAWQASSTIARPCRCANPTKASIGAGWPYRCTGMIATVRGPVTAAIAPGSRQKRPARCRRRPAAPPPTTPHQPSPRTKTTAPPPHPPARSPTPTTPTTTPTSPSSPPHTYGRSPAPKTPPQNPPPHAPHHPTAPQHPHRRLDPGLTNDRPRDGNRDVVQINHAWNSPADNPI
jgi:hypothetical protein